ncbi:MAG: hypothetical protein EU529_06030 [Promethearchaeota archaeon]|nr:MAG: hypothetical protein EU529_06030 [Candidatus Lokiarchaeota archaeon]
MNEINFITIGDKDFFPLIHFSIKQVLKFYPTSKLFIYDWGFTLYQKKKISTFPNTILIDWTDKLDKENGYKTIRYTNDMENRVGISRKREYFLNQKPFCMLDCAKRIKENLIFFDGDAILINPIDEILEDNYDIGLTVNVEFAAKHKHNSIGPRSWIKGINSGIIFFKLNSKPMQIFIQEWINEIKTYKGVIMIEQNSLFNIIVKRNREILYKEYNIGIIKLANLEYRIKIFPTRLYNYLQIGVRYNDKKVKFLHLVSMRRHYPKNLSKSLIIRDYIREMKIRMAFNHFLRAFSLILLPKIKKKIIVSFNKFLIYRKKKKKKRNYSFSKKI